MVDKLFEFGFGKRHKTLDLGLRSVKVLQTKSIDCDNLYTTLVANFQDLCTSQNNLHSNKRERNYRTDSGHGLEP